jgi:hypothetical protein
MFRRLLRDPGAAASGGTSDDKIATEKEPGEGKPAGTEKGGKTDLGEKPDPKDAQIEAERKRAADFEAKVKAFEEKEEKERQAKLSAEEKAKEKADKAEAELKRLQRENLVTKLAAKAGLDPDVWDRLRGDTEDEIAADIKFWEEKLPKPAEDGDGDEKGVGKAGKGKADSGKLDYRTMSRAEFQKHVREKYKANV